MRFDTKGGKFFFGACFFIAGFGSAQFFPSVVEVFFEEASLQVIGTVGVAEVADVPPVGPIVRASRVVVASESAPTVAHSHGVEVVSPDSVVRAVGVVSPGPVVVRVDVPVKSVSRVSVHEGSSDVWGDLHGVDVARDVVQVATPRRVLHHQAVAA